MMPLSPEQEWTLVACGLMAHADGILEVGEWDQVLFMLDDRIDDAEANVWVDRLAKREALEIHLESLSLPPPLFTESILEKAWRMGMADGGVSETETKVHDRLAGRLEAPVDSLGRWREQWRAQAEERGELIAGFAALLAHVDGRVDTEERLRYEELLMRLPVAEDRREAVSRLFDEPPKWSELAARFTQLDPESRGVALLGLVPIVCSYGGERERQAFLQLAESIAIERAEALAMLDRS